MSGNGCEAMFAVTAERCPQLLCRLLGMIAQQDRVVEWVRVDSTPRRYRIAIGVCGLDPQRAEILRAKMAALVNVHVARLDLPAAAPRGPVPSTARERASDPV